MFVNVYNENNNENGLAWYSPLAWCFASIVVVCSYHPNAQAPNNPSRGEANGRCDITPNVSGRCFLFTDIQRQVKCMLFCESVGGCDDCVFPQIYTSYTSRAANSMLATRWFRCFHLKECFASLIGSWKSNGGCPHVTKIHDLPMLLIKSSIRSDALQCNAEVVCALLAFCCSWTGGAYCCRGRETWNIIGGSSCIKLSTSIHQNWSRLKENGRVKTTI